MHFHNRWRTIHELAALTSQERRAQPQIEFQADPSKASESVTELLRLWGSQIPEPPAETAPAREGHQYIINLDAFRRRAESIQKSLERVSGVQWTRKGLRGFADEIGGVQLTPAFDEIRKGADMGDFLVLRPNCDRKTCAYLTRYVVEKVEKDGLQLGPII
jgi:hypothetical protein